MITSPLNLTLSSPATLSPLEQTSTTQTELSPQLNGNDEYSPQRNDADADIKLIKGSDMRSSERKATVVKRARSDPSICKKTTQLSATPRTKTPAGNREQIASESDMRQQDLMRAEEIYTKMRAERSIHIAKMQAIIANMQTEIQRIWNEVILRRQKTHDDMLEKWVKVMFG